MIPAYIAHAVWFGVVYLVDPQNRAQRAPALSLAHGLGLPMRSWGVMYLLIGALMLFALIRHSRQLYVWMLYCYAVVMIWWAVIYAGSLLISRDASIAGIAWPLLVAVACHASAKSILRGEIRP